MKRSSRWTWLSVTCALGLIACSHQKDAAQTSGQTPAAAASDHSLPTLTLPADVGSPPAIDGDRAMQYVNDIVKFGPRPLASANHKKVEDYIASRLKGDAVEDDTFTADPARARRIAQLLKPLGITWSTNSRANVGYETLKVM